MKKAAKSSDAKVTHAPKEAAKPASGSSTYVDGENVPNPTGAPEDAEDAAVFQQGRTASLGGISKEDAPYDQSDAKHKVWLNGFKSVER